jgi:protein-S-isoprenylcysteine O-methyltransferase Ste14
VLMLLRHALAIAILPLTVAVLVPAWIGRRTHLTLHTGAGVSELALQILGLVSLAIGLMLFVSSLRQFVSRGRGTLAPWDPPVHLVVHGPYRYVRNPMISGVIFVLIGEALVLLSRPHAAWAAAVFAINAIYIPLLEEPMLRERFGDEYREYTRHVPRLFPRVRPWMPPGGRLTVEPPAADDRSGEL